MLLTGSTKQPNGGYRQRKWKMKECLQNAPSRQIGLSLLAAEDDPVVPKDENYLLTLILHPGRNYVFTFFFLFPF